MDVESCSLHEFHHIVDMSDQEIGTLLIALMKDKYLILPGLEEINRISILGRKARQKRGWGNVILTMNVQNINYLMGEHVLRRHKECEVGSRTFSESSCKGQLYWEYKKTPFDVTIEDFRGEWN